MGNCIDDKPNVAEKSLNRECSIMCTVMSDKDMETKDVEGGKEMDLNTTLQPSIDVRIEDVEKEGMMESINDSEFMNGNSAVATDNEEIETERQLFEEEENFEDINRSNKENIQDTISKRKNINKSSSSRKKSKNQIKEERLKIHSETHRLMREREISIPYHIPKQRTLKEFLSRKKNRANIPLNTPSSKMVEIWKDIEESTRNAFEFFKSDSESDCEANSNLKNEVENHKAEEKEREGLVICQNGKTVLCNDNIGNDGSGKEEQENSRSYSPCPGNDSEHVIKENVNVLSEVGEHLTSCEPSVDKTDVIPERTNFIVNSCETNDNCDGLPHTQKGGSENDKSSLAKNVDDSCITNTNIDPAENADESGVDDAYARERTSEWVKNIPVYEKMLKQNKKEMLLQKLNPKLLKITPKLSGEQDSFIDLESEKNGIEIGAKNLKKRFIKNCIIPKKKPNAEVELTITSYEKNDQGEVTGVATETLIYNSVEILNDPELEKPGAKLQRLREELKKKIEDKWEEEHKRKTLELQAEAALNKEKKLNDDDILDDEEEILDDPEDSDEGTEESEPEEDDILITDKPKSKNDFIDSEAEESDCEDELSGNEAGDELDDECPDLKENESSDIPENLEQCEESLSDRYCADSQNSFIPPYQPGGGMLNGGSELSQCEESNLLPKGVLSPVLGISLDLSPNKNTSNTSSQNAWDLDLKSPKKISHSNFVPCYPENANCDLDDAYEFCSGKFPDEVDSQAQIASQENESRLESITLKSLDFGKNDEDNTLQKKKSRLKIVSDDSEDDVDREVDDSNDLEHITTRISSDDSNMESEDESPKIKNKRKNLRFSDEEDDSGPEEDNEADAESEPLKDDEDENEEEPEEYDSSHEEEAQFNKEVQYNSDEEEINPVEFFEKEAELSGSEWSGDEDEKDLDKLEEEDGDADQLDDNKVRSQLEKIHMRTLLDDDARDVRLLQELLFEDGDLYDDGPKRERNYRWKDLGTFFDDDDKSNEGVKSQGQEEIEEDEQSAKIRHEKELFLLQLKKKRDEDEEGTSLLKLGKVILEKSRHCTVAKTTCSKGTEVDEIAVKTSVALTNKRGSFLSRNEEFLSRLAKFTSNANDNILGPKNSKNFVFATKSPEKVNPSTKENSPPKRRNRSPTGENRSKKARLDFGKETVKTSILDRLA